MYFVCSTAYLVTIGFGNANTLVTGNTPQGKRANAADYIVAAGNFMIATARGKGEGKISAPEKTYQTYTKTGPKGEVYSGRTSGKSAPEKNVANRDVKHHMNEKGFGKAVLDKSSTNKNAIRGREQQLIDNNGGAKSQGGTSGNQINGISPNNPNKDVYINQANNEFKR